MNEHELTGPEHVQNPEVTYEPRDLSARAVIGFFLALAIAGVVVQLALWGYYKYMVGTELQPQPATTSIITTKQQQEDKQLAEVGGNPAANFPSPRLQPDPVADLNKFRVREEELLNSYGWVDQAAGKVHIPIERAIEIVAQTGLPTRSEPQVSQEPLGATQAAGGVNIKRGREKLPRKR